MVLAFFLSLAAIAEDPPPAGSIAELSADAELLKAPQRSAQSHGLLPKGTFVRVLGEVQDRFSLVEVELDSGMVEGWLPQSLLTLGDLSSARARPRSRPRSQALEADPESEAETVSEVKPKKLRRRVPDDEQILLRRKPTFFYGPNLALNYNLIAAAGGSSYAGIGYTAGAHFGFYLQRDFPLRFEIAYMVVSGSDASNTIDIGFINAGVSAAYHVNNVELFARVLWAFGASVSNLPGSIGFTGAVSELGGPWMGLGVGYKMALSPMFQLTGRLGYQLGLNQSVFGIHVIGAQFLLDIQG